MENYQEQVCVLLVEDDPGDQKLIRTALFNEEYKIKLSIASSGEAAINYLLMGQSNPEQYPKPNIILLDLNMPGMGGKEFLKRIKASEDFSLIPVVVVTTSDSETDIRECYSLNAAGYIKKMEVPDEFVDVIEKLSKYWFEFSSLVRN